MEPACLIWWMRKTKQRSHIDFFTKTPIMNAFFFSMDTLIFIYKKKKKKQFTPYKFEEFSFRPLGEHLDCV